MAGARPEHTANGPRNRCSCSRSTIKTVLRAHAVSLTLNVSTTLLLPQTGYADLGECEFRRHALVVYQATLAVFPALPTVSAVAICGRFEPKAVHLWRFSLPSRQCKPPGWQPGKLSCLLLKGSVSSVEGLRRQTGSRRRWDMRSG